MKVSYTIARRLTQLGFLTVCLFIALAFIRFVLALETGTVPDVARPPGVEAFLPISALVSLKYFLSTGILNPVHPSAVLILGFAVLTALGVAKSFCAWVCPIGLLSECLFMLRKKWRFFRVSITGVWDRLLRSLKYLVLAFFVATIFFRMSGPELAQFIYSAYHITADIQLFHFFSGMRGPTMGILGALIGLSFVFPYFWCRYLCPYGALMGLAGLLAPVRVRRNAATCTGCRQCDRACPSRIRISGNPQVRSDECISCGRCADACPESGTLGLSAGGRTLHPAAVAAFVVLVFWGGASLARTAGIWQNRIPVRDYFSAMLETGSLDPGRVKDLDSLIQVLDRRGKRLLMMRMFKEKG